MLNPVVAMLIGIVVMMVLIKMCIRDSCKPVCKLCPNLVISQAVTFTGGNLEINLPAGSYNNGEKYCIVVAQAIPDTATINAPVYMTIGTGTTLRCV